ncbi:MAG: PASTA domain-containing protein [Lentimicrobium sp.]|jgi:beta-lactam-binding protein with PASTA domain|nr:PASTA domain-containing protein [Lentimicrobium sp.]MDD2526749.1 PASTA domain-containing protein [Lentimicrobiaceae bacterium]MDD4596473.1 PASTA domain-containing protein [Lentimicrobiaceae bacterium]MDY0024715.1 PASTA domain-containing protein [Lentimicrobium sp.]HAH59843.1 serine/threonine protein kinase [Bacteroidales bacterium]
MNFFQFLQTRVFLRNFAASVVITVILAALVLWMLKGYTHHGEAVTVPSLLGLMPNQLNQLETIDNFDVIIVDSVYDARLPKGSVAIQDPLPGSKVKMNRKIYLTLVSTLPEKVAMPNLIDLTLRQAKATLETYGLRLGEVKYVPDIAQNAVLGQSYQGHPIPPGQIILKGSGIELKVGQSVGSGRVQIPFLLGKTRDEALRLLGDHYLTLGDETYEDDAEPETARVYSQSPSYVKGMLINAGQTVSLVFRDPEKFDFDEYLNLMIADTLDVTVESQ